MFIAVLNFRCEFCAVFCCNEMRLFIMFQVDDEAVNEIMPAVTSTPVPHECIMIHWHAMHLSSQLALLCRHFAVSSPKNVSVVVFTVCYQFSIHIHKFPPIMKLIHIPHFLSFGTQYCTFCMSPFFAMPDSGHGASAIGLMSRIRFVWEARHQKCSVLGSHCTDSTFVWKYLRRQAFEAL